MTRQGFRVDVIGARRACHVDRRAFWGFKRASFAAKFVSSVSVVVRLTRCCGSGFLLMRRWKRMLLWCLRWVASLLRMFIQESEIGVNADHKLSFHLCPSKEVQCRFCKSSCPWSIPTYTVDTLRRKVDSNHISQRLVLGWRRTLSISYPTYTPFLH